MDKLFVCIPVCSYCASLVADLYLFCYGRDLMLSLPDKNQAYSFEAFNSTQDILMTF